MSMMKDDAIERFKYNTSSPHVSNVGLIKEKVEAV